MDQAQAAYVAAALFGAFTGISQLLTRYKDAPAQIFKILAAWIYIALNAGASALALYVLHVFDLRFGFGAAEVEKVFLAQVVVAGFGALILLRTNFSFKAGDSEVKVGPSQVLEVFLDTSDQSIDRIRQKRNHDFIAAIMHGISYHKARVPLPSICFMRKKDIGVEQQQRVLEQLKSLDESPGLTNRVKALNLGTMLSDVVGIAILYQAVRALGDEIVEGPPVGKADGGSPPQIAPQLFDGMRQRIEPISNDDQPATEPASKTAA